MNAIADWFKPKFNWCEINKSSQRYIWILLSLQALFVSYLLLLSNLFWLHCLVFLLVVLPFILSQLSEKLSTNNFHCFGWKVSFRRAVLLISSCQLNLVNKALENQANASAFKSLDCSPLALSDVDTIDSLKTLKRKQKISLTNNVPYLKLLWQWDREGYLTGFFHLWFSIDFRKWQVSRLADISVCLFCLTLYLLVTLRIKEKPKTYDANRETQRSKLKEVK